MRRVSVSGQLQVDIAAIPEEYILFLIFRQSGAFNSEVERCTLRKLVKCSSLAELNSSWDREKRKALTAGEKSKKRKYDAVVEVQ